MKINHVILITSCFCSRCFLVLITFVQGSLDAFGRREASCIDGSNELHLFTTKMRQLWEKLTIKESTVIMQPLNRGELDPGNAIFQILAGGGFADFYAYPVRSSNGQAIREKLTIFRERTAC